MTSPEAANATRGYATEVTVANSGGVMSAVVAETCETLVWKLLTGGFVLRPACGARWSSKSSAATYTFTAVSEGMPFSTYFVSVCAVRKCLCPHARGAVAEPPEGVYVYAPTSRRSPSRDAPHAFTSATVGAPSVASAAR